MNAQALMVALAVLLAGLAAGLGAVLFVPAVQGDPLLLAALPLVLTLLLLLVIDRRLLFLSILLLRASADLVLESTKVAGGIGVGGLINALVIVIALLCVLERPALLTRRLLSIWLPLLLAALVAVGYTPEPREAARVFLVLLSYAAVFVIAFHLVRTRADFDRCLDVILWSSLIPTLYALLQAAQQLGELGELGGEGFRLSSTFSHPNILAFYLVLIITLLFYRLKSRPAAPLLQGALWGHLLLLIGLLLLTQTRSAWAACLAMFAAYGLLFQRRYLLYLVLLPLLALLVPGVRERLLDLGSGNEYVQHAKLNSFAWRQILWKSALEWMSPARYLHGYGLNAFKFYTPQFFPLAGGIHWGAHSTYVQWFFETGAAGVLTAAWMYLRLFCTLAAGAAADRLGTVLAVMLLVEYLFFSFSDNMLDYLAFNWYYWFFVGAACALTLARLRPGPAAQARHPAAAERCHGA